MGYKKKRSKESLIASSIIAGLLLISAYLMGRPDTTYGVRLALGTPTSRSFSPVRNASAHCWLACMVLCTCAQTVKVVLQMQCMRCTLCCKLGGL